MNFPKVINLPMNRAIIYLDKVFRCFVENTHCIVLEMYKVGS